MLKTVGQVHGRACLIVWAALLVACQTPPDPDLALEDRPEVKEAIAQYRRDVLLALQRFKRYPRSALTQKQEGRVDLRVVIAADGRIKTIAVEQSSGHTVLDDQARDMVGKAKPTVPIPRILRGREFSIPVSFIFDLQDRSN